MSDRSEYQARQAASVAADDAIAKAAGVTACKVIERPVCLVTSFAERADLPPGALLYRMSPEIAATLAGIGLHEPVSLRHLPGKWWIAEIDAAAENSSFEPGGCMIFSKDGALWQLIVASGQSRVLVAPDKQVDVANWMEDGSGIIYSSKQSGDWQLWQLDLATAVVLN